MRVLLVQADTNNYLATSEAVFSYIVISVLAVLTPEGNSVTFL